MEFGPNTSVTVRCNKCGKEYCFFPMRVIALGECDCGNGDWGHSRNWSKGNFGTFTFVEQEELIFNLISPFRPYTLLTKEDFIGEKEKE